MKKIVQMNLVCVIIFFLIFTYFIPIISYAKSKNYEKYIALGDSITYGYGLDNRNADSYPQKVRKKYNIETSKFQNLAVSGMTCEEFYQYINTEKITKAIKETELITVSIGSNELLGIVTDAISKATGVTVNEGEDFVEKVKEKIKSVGMQKKIEILKTFYNNLTSENMKVRIEVAIKTYQDNWMKSVQYIKKINPQISIIALEFYNPYYEVSVLSYDFGGFVDEQIQKLNEILWDSSNSEKEYKIAKIYDAFNTTSPRLTNVNTSINNFNVDPHPNTLGHEMICTKVLDELAEVTQDKIDIASLTITDIPDQTYTGKEIIPQITIKQGNTKLEENTDYTLSYSENINIGEAKITITGIGNYKGKVIKTFNIKEKERKNLKDMTIKTIENQIYTGIKITPTIEITDGTKKLTENTDYKLDYKNNINVGNATIIITGIGNYQGRLEKNFNIIEKDIKDATIKEIPEQIKTGKEITPDIEISDGSIKLQKGKDYTVEYSNNIEEGTATANIQGKGNYTGNITKQFNIIQEKTVETKDISELEITDISDKIYTGKLITPEVRIKDGDKVLTKNTDYLINYTNNIEIGKGKAIIIGLGEYTGRIEKEFNILRKNITNTMIKDISDQVYTGKEIKPEFIITSDYIELEEGKDYTKEYRDNVEEGTATIIIKGMGNYTGTTIKTFNIKREQEEQREQNNNKKDETIANKTIPFAGNKLLICLSIILLFIISGICFIKYKKLFDI